MSTALDLSRHLGDTANQVLSFWSDDACTVEFPLTGRTFAGHVEKANDVEVFALTCTVGAGADTHRVTMAPTSPGAWTDLKIGVRYRWSMWETTGGVTVTIFSGAVLVVDR